MRQTIQATLPPAGEFSERPAVLHADFGTCSRTIEPIAKPIPLLQDTF